MNNQSIVVRILIITTLIILAIIYNKKYIKKYGLYKYAEKHILVYSGYIVLIICSIVINLTFLDDAKEIGDEIDSVFKNIIFNIISNYGLAILIMFNYSFEKKIKNKSEDREKLTGDYNALVKRYKKKNLLKFKETYVNGEKIEEYYPVESLGEGDICVYDNPRIDTRNINISDKKNEYILPTLIENNFSSIMEVHSTSIVYNNTCIRAKDLKIENNKLMISSERTRFCYSLVTNRASDYDWTGYGITVRLLYEPGPGFKPLNRSWLSNHLGFNGFIVSKDNYVVFVKRSEDVSIAKETYGDSIGASLKAEYALTDDGFFTAQKLVVAIICEIGDELKINKDDISNIHIIGAYRDGLESGKPQLLFYAETNRSAEKITEDFTKKTNKKLDDKIKETKDKNEKDKLKAEMKVIQDGSKLVWIKKDSLCDLQFYIDKVCFNKDEAKDKKGFFEIKRDKRTNSLKDQSLPMVPSASASLLMFTHYLSKSVDK